MEAHILSRARVFTVLSALAFTTSLGGCLPRQVAKDGVNVRQALLDMYTDQVMDNLIRAHDNLPFVQIAYSDVTVQDNDQLGSTLTGNWPGSMFGATGNASRSRTLSVVANPITDQNDIYDAYLAFATDSGLFRVSCDDPGCAAHIVRERNKMYYWVPTEAASLFLDLTLSTTFKRGPEAAPPSAYEVTIVAVPKVENPNLKNGMPIDAKRPGDLTIAYLTLSSSVPSGDATMVAKLADGRTIRVTLKRIPTRMSGGKEVPVPDGELTTEFRTLAWSPKATGYTEHDLEGAKARIYSHDYPIDAPVAAPRTFQRIKADVNFLRNQQGQFRR